jgi:hypothetical protein
MHSTDIVEAYGRRVRRICILDVLPRGEQLRSAGDTEDKRLDSSLGLDYSEDSRRTNSTSVRLGSTCARWRGRKSRAG